MLFEMLTGKRTFEGKTQASLLGAVLEREPTPVTELQPLTPPALARVVRTCLAKDPNDRFQTAHDLLLQLRWIEEGGSAAGLPAPVISHRKRLERAIWIGALLAASAATALAAWLIKPAPAVTNIVTRFTFTLPEGQQFSHTDRRFVAIAPDGSKVAYIANNQIYLRAMGQLTVQPLAGTYEDPLDLVFSPDGQWIAYFAASAGGSTKSTLKKIAVSGGAPVKLCATEAPFGSTWRNGTIVFGQNGATVHGIQAVADTGGTPRGDLWVWDLAHEILMRLTFGLDESNYPAWTPDGRHVVFASREQVLRIAADGTGTPETLLAVDRHIEPHGVSPDGKFLVYLEDRQNMTKWETDILALPLDGHGQPRLLIHTNFLNRNAAISPDGRWIAYQSDESGNNEIYVRPFPAVDSGRWQVSNGGGTRPVWSHDGHELFYAHR